MYRSFLSNKAAEPIHKLVQKNVSWNSTEKYDGALTTVKDRLSSSTVLILFIEKIPIVVTCDVSPYGVGSALSYKISNGREAHVAYASITLTSIVKNYSQIYKEAFSVVYAVKNASFL